MNKTTPYYDPKLATEQRAKRNEEVALLRGTLRFLLGFGSYRIRYPSDEAMEAARKHKQVEQKRD